MATIDPLTQFVRDALVAGRSRADIRTALETAGWSNKQIDSALDTFSEVEFTPPVPRPRVLLTTRDAFIYALLFTAMFFSAIYVTVFGHALVDLWLLDADDTAAEEMSHLRWSVAVLIIALPLFIGLTFYTNRRAAQDASHKQSLVRKRLTYLTLFVSALIFSIDAIAVIYTFLEDQITVQFLLHASVIAAVSAAVFLFYLRDVEGMKIKDGLSKE